MNTESLSISSYPFIAASLGDRGCRRWSDETFPLRSSVIPKWSRRILDPIPCCSRVSNVPSRDCRSRSWPVPCVGRRRKSSEPLHGTFGIFVCDSFDHLTVVLIVPPRLVRLRSHKSHTLRVPRVRKTPPDVSECCAFKVPGRTLV